MQKIFITSSGTNVGKTFFTCALAKHFINQKKSMHAIKPVVSGFEFDTIPNDIFYIANSIEIAYTKENINKLNLYSFEKPLSPDMASRIEKKPYIDYEKLKSFCKKSLLKDNEILIVETVGGVCVPINQNKIFLDLIEDCADKVVLVVGSYLGSLSHTITSYKVLESVGKKPDLIVVSQNLPKSNELFIPVVETIKSLEKFTSCPIIAIEKLQGAETTKINKLTKILDDVEISKFLK
jgi:dethiobiotin synthetase